MGFDVHRSDCVLTLAGALVDALRTPLADPMAAELVVVEQSGMEQWVAEQLAGGLNVCANIRFGRAAELVSGLLGEAASTSLTAWAPGRLRWAVYAALSEARLSAEMTTTPELEQLLAYVARPDDATGVRERKRLGLASRVAQVFSRYAGYRADRLREWLGGGGEGWMPWLFRDVHARIETPHLVELADSFDGALPGGAERLFLFGVSTLSPFVFDLLQRASVDRDITLFIPSTGPHAVLGAHPLSRAMCRVEADLHALLQGGANPPTVHHHWRAAGPAPSWLDRLKHDLREGRPPSAGPTDGSIRCLSAHGPTRQLEALRDELLRMMAADPTLQPRHIAVLCPDIERLAPLVTAVFEDGMTGSSTARRAAEWDGFGFPQLRYFVADRSLRASNPVAAALLAVLELADGRLYASEVLDLLSHPPLRDRFRIGLDDIETIRSLMAEAGVRWGRDEPHREREQRPAHDNNTWRFALDRLLLGLACADEVSFAGRLAAGGDDSGHARIAQSLISFGEALLAMIPALNGRHQPGDWATILRDTLDALVARRPDTEWQHQQVLTAIDEFVGGARQTGMAEALTLGAVRQALDRDFGIGQAHAGFTSGAITFGALLPMRTIPFRVVCLVGMDQGTFPRATERLPYDELVTAPRPGDRNPRHDDRQLFIEAVLAARDALIVAWTGRDPGTNRALAPAVPVAELLETLALMARRPGESEADTLDRIITRVPLHPFSPELFDAAAPGQQSFARRFMPVAEALSEPPEPIPPFVDGPLDGETPTLSLDSLRQTFRKGLAWHYMVKVLGARLDETDNPLADDDPLSVRQLDEWVIGDGLVAGLRDGQTADALWALETARGRLVPGALGRREFERVFAGASDVWEQAKDHCRTPRAALPVDLRLPAGRLSGSVTDLYDGGRNVIIYSKLGAKYELAVWIDHLVLCAAHPKTPWVSRLFGRPRPSGDSTWPSGVVSFAPVPETEARRCVNELVAIYHDAHRWPLPFFSAASLAAYEGVEPQTAWANDWDSGKSPVCVRLFGDEVPLGPLSHLGLDLPESRQFDALAETIWGARTPYRSEEIQ